MKRIAIIGGGIAGLTAACELARLARDGAQVEAILFESSNRLGGLIETVREGGFTIEAGPDGWVSAKPWARELAIELGLESELIPSNDATRKTHIFLTTPENPSGRLVPMPDGLNLMVPTNLAALEGSPLFTAAAIAAYRDEPARAAQLLTSALPPPVPPPTSPSPTSPSATSAGKCSIASPPHCSVESSAVTFANSPSAPSCLPSWKWNAPTAP